MLITAVVNMCVFCSLEPIIFPIKLFCIWQMILFGLVTLIGSSIMPLGEYRREREKLEIEEERRLKLEVEKESLTEREPLFIEDVVITNLTGNVLWSHSKGRGEVRACEGEEAIISIYIRNRSDYKLSARVGIEYDYKPVVGVKPTITVLPHKLAITKVKLIIPEYGKHTLRIRLE